MGTQSTTVLFTDMEASTEFSLSHGDARAVEIMHRQESVVRAAADAHGGSVLKNTGDGFLAVFSDCGDGVLAALEIRRRAEEQNRSDPEHPLRLRIGLHTGEVIEDSGDVFGLTVSAAARVTSKAAAGQVLVSDEVCRNAPSGDEWTYTDRGSFWLKGLREKWRLHEVTARDEPARMEASSDSDLPFVGRDAERATLRRIVDGVEDGRGSFVLVTGNAGSGKTRFVQEVGHEAESRGLRFLVGRCYDEGRAEPYAALVDVFESLERQMGSAAFRALIGDAAGEISRLLPHLRGQHPDVGPSLEAGTGVRRYFFASVRDVLQRAAAQRPLLVFVDDVQWADAPTIAFLEQLALDVADTPVVVVVSYTVEAMAQSTPLPGLLATLHRLHVAESLSLEPLDRNEVAHLLSAASGHDPPDSLVDSVLAVTEGNAFFLGEMVLQLRSMPGMLDESGWRHENTATELEVPESVRLVIEDRLTRLGPVTRSVLNTACVLGVDFSLELLEALIDFDEDELLDSIEEAERSHFLMSSVDVDMVRFAFQHRLIRQALEAQLSHTRRQRLHARAAAALESLHADNLATHAATIAGHLDQAGGSADRDRKIRFLTLAGARALDSAAFEDASAHLQRVLTLIPPGDAERRGPVLERLAATLRSMGDLDQALATWGEALDTFDSAGDDHAVARVALNAALEVAWWRRGRDVTRLVERGLSALGDEQNATRGGILAVSGMVASQSGNFEQAQVLLEEALDLTARHPDERIIGMTLYAKATHEFAYQRFDETVEVGLESIGYLRRSGDLWNLASVLGYVATAQGWLGHFDEAAEVGAEGEELAMRLGNWSAFVFAEQARRFRDIGKHPSADGLEERGRQALDLGEELGFAWLASIGHARVGLAAFWRGDWTAALTEFETAAEIEVRGATGGHLGRLMLVRAYLDDRSGALELAARARPDFPVVGRPSSVTSWGLVTCAVEVFAMVGAVDDAAALVDTMDDLDAAGVVMRGWDFRLVASLQGIASGCAGDFGRAEERFEAALEMSRALPMRREEPEVHRFHAQMLLRRDGPGDRERAAGLVDRAVSLYEDLGMPAHIELARRLLR